MGEELVVPVARLAAGAAEQQHLAPGMALLRPEERVFTAMLDGWRAQQLARNLAFGTIDGREHAVRAFAGHADAFPWTWTPELLDEWLGDLRVVRRLKRSTLRNYQEAVRSFCAYVTDPAYRWTTACVVRFGTAPMQICHEWNTAVHVQVAYGYGLRHGLRRNETRMLDVVDFGRNPQGPEFGAFGVCYVRHGQAMRGSPPKRRSVLTVWRWTAEIVAQWVEEIRPALATAAPAAPAATAAPADSLALWPSERDPRVGLTQLNARFAAYRDALGLDPHLDFHSLRRSYVTHLIEDGWDALFVQQQVGHEHASTTAIYTCVSSDFRTRTLRRALDATLAAALRPGRERPPGNRGKPGRSDQRDQRDQRDEKEREAPWRRR